MTDIRTTGLLDDFERPDENPIQPPWIRVKGGASGNLIISTGVVGSTTFPNDTPRYAYSIFSTNGPQEAWGIASGNAALQDGIELGLFTDILSFKSGYEAVLWDSVGGGRIDLRKYDSGGYTVIDSYGGFSFNTGDIVLLRLTSTDVEVWISTDGGATWLQTNTYADTTYRTNMFVTLGVTGVETGWEAVGGGFPNRTQIYRWLPSIS